VSENIEVRRNGRLAVLVAASAALVAAAFFVRGGGVSYAIGSALLVLAVLQAWSAYDARTPLLVVDRQGVRIRLGRAWRGLPWESVAEIEHLPRRHWWKDGRLAVLPVDEDEQLAGLGRSAGLQARATEMIYGVPFSVPLGLTTRVVGAGDGLTESLGELVGGDAQVVEIDPAAAEEPVEDTAEDTAESLAAFEESPEAIPAEDLPGPTDTNPRLERPLVASPTPSPLRQAASAIRFDAIWKRGETAPIQGANALRLEPTLGVVEDEREDTALRLATVPDADADADADADDTHAGPVEAGSQAAAEEGVETADTTADTTDTADEVAEEPAEETAEETSAAPAAVEDPELTEVLDAPEPVVGPELAAARTRLGLTVESLAERTRIRPHVIESIEVDDFGPCGGDFYARGHLRTLARVLGKDATPLLEAYEERYADGPVNPRAVFAGQLATGSTSSLRKMRGGPNWSVLVAAVMAVVLLWSIARLVMDSRPHEPEAAISLGSGSIANPYAKTADPVPVTVSAAGGGAHVVIRDARGQTVFTGDLPFGATKTVDVSPPVRIQTSDGSLEVSLDGGDATALGKTGKAAQRTFTVG